MADTASFAEHLAPGIREIVGTNLGGRQSFYTQLGSVETSERNYEDYLAGAGLPIATLKPELQAIQSFDPLEGNTLRVSHNVYAIGFEVSEEAWEDDLYQGRGSALRDASNNMADSLAEVVEVQFHRMFNAEAFLTSAVPSFMQTLPDNAATVSIYNTSHGPIAGGEAAGQANQPATDVDLTITSFRAGLTQFRDWRNDRNLRIPGYTSPSKLVVPLEQEWDAKEILQSPMRPDTAANAKNVTAGIVQLIVDPYIDQAASWFLLGQKNFLKFIWRWRPRMDSFDDRRTRAAVMVAYERFSQVAVHWLGVYASDGI